MTEGMGGTEGSTASSDAGDSLQLFTQNDTGEYVSYEPPKPLSFKERLPEDLRESEHLRGMENTEQLAKAYADVREGLPVVPENYEMQFPDGFKLDEGTYNGFKDAAREAGLTQKQFEKIVGFEVERSQRMEEQMRNDVRTHRESAENDLKQQWGDNYDQNLETAKRVFNRFADDNVKQWVEDSRFGDSPQVIRLMAEIGKVLSEDILIGGTTQTSSGEAPRDAVGRRTLTFPSMEEKK